MEVIYSGLQQTPEAIALSALQESVDLIGVFILTGVHVLSGAHVHLANAIMAALGAQGIAIVSPVVGGIIPPQDADELRCIAVADVYTQGWGYRRHHRTAYSPRLNVRAP